MYICFLGLAFWSEQAFESVHADFKLYWESQKVDIDHPDYLAKLLACISRWNARHIQILYFELYALVTTDE